MRLPRSRKNHASSFVVHLEFNSRALVGGIYLSSHIFLTHTDLTMSTRFYARYVKGNPQLRIFLPDWKMVMIKPDKPMPNHIVTFRVDPRMTDYDVKNYIEKIYKVQVGAVNSYISAGSLKKTREGLAKRDDFKTVRVTLPLGTTFEWPDLFPQEKRDELQSDYTKTMEALNEGRRLNPNTRLPSWVAKFATK